MGHGKGLDLSQNNMSPWVVLSGGVAWSFPWEVTRFKDYFGFEIHCDLVIAWIVSSREELQVGGGSVESWWARFPTYWVWHAYDTVSPLDWYHRYANGSHLVDICQFKFNVSKFNGNPVHPTLKSASSHLPHLSKWCCHLSGCSGLKFRNLNWIPPSLTHI